MSDFSTNCVHISDEKIRKQLKDRYGAVCHPIYQSATFAHEGLNNSTGYDYSRLQNPSRNYLENLVNGLEGGEDTIAFTSGMAAINTLMETFKIGDKIIIDSDLYGGSIRIFEHINSKNGLIFVRLNLTKDDPKDYIDKDVKAIFLETPTNPMMNIIDIKKIAEITKKEGILLIVDNTFLSPYFQKPLELGADVVIHSGTKFLGGHNDTLAGFLVVKEKEFAEKIRFISKTLGACLSPFDCFLIARGIKTLPLRMEKASNNAIIIAEYLKQQKAVKKVYYPGLKEHSGHEIIKKQATGFGCMLTFEVFKKEDVKVILDNVALIQYAESLGGVETLITYPITQTHADVSKELLELNNITDRTLRLSIGIEDAYDLIKDLEQVFRRCEEE